MSGHAARQKGMSRQEADQLGREPLAGDVNEEIASDLRYVELRALAPNCRDLTPGS